MELTSPQRNGRALARLVPAEGSVRGNSPGFAHQFGGLDRSGSYGPFQQVVDASGKTKYDRSDKIVSRTV
jgi:hypothetical protein